MRGGILAVVLSGLVSSCAEVSRRTDYVEDPDTVADELCVGSQVYVWGLDSHGRRRCKGLSRSDAGSLSICGNAVCEPGESRSSCEADCRARDGGGVEARADAVQGGIDAGKPLLCATAPRSSTLVNVRDKGATANDTTDDTQAIQAAVDEVTGTGGTVFVPDGMYLIDAIKMVKLKSDLTFRMAPGAVLRAIPNAATHYSILQINRQTKVQVIGGTVQGERDEHQGTTGEWGMGVDLRGASNVVVEGVLAKDFWGDGFYVDTAATDATFCRVVADNNRRQGMSIVYGSRIVVRESIFKNTAGTNPMAGIDIEPDSGDTVSGVVIHRCQFINNLQAGVELWGGEANGITDVVIENCFFSGNTTGIQISGTHHHRVASNVIMQGSYIGILLDNKSTGNVIVGNDIHMDEKWRSNGIIDSEVGGNTITSNTVNGQLR